MFRCLRGSLSGSVRRLSACTDNVRSKGKISAFLGSLPLGSFILGPLLFRWLIVGLLMLGALMVVLTMVGLLMLCLRLFGWLAMVFSCGTCAYLAC